MTPTAAPHPLDVLLVEDNLGDARLIQEALAGGSRRCQVHIVKDGVEALAYLQGEVPYAQSRRPDLILMDLNLPRLRGEEVLATLKAHPEWKRIPVLILSSSSAERDIQRCYELHANCYLIKPMDWDAYGSLLRAVETFWVGFAKLAGR